MNGYINSFQSMGAVDGPGLRYVIFMQGCPLRCIYCHNPETWRTREGEICTPEFVCERIIRYQPYFGEEGGVTVSGGEPLMQPEFVAALFCLLKEKGIHTALDTSGAGELKKAAEVLKYTDLVLCDLKFSTEEAYREHCGGSLSHTLAFMRLAETMKVPMWVRHVVAPGLTDSPENIREIKRIAEDFSNLVKIEWLPFKNICKVKYDRLKLDFTMGDSTSYSQKQVNQLVSESEDA